MSFWKDFKTFAMKGNVIDLAVGVIVGGAFGKIVNAVVDDIIMPPIGMVTGGLNFTDKFVVLKPAKEGDIYTSLDAAKKAGANVFAWGDFVQTVVNFLIVAFCIFIAIRIIARMRAKEEAAAAAKPSAFGPSPTESLLTEIRDLLKKQQNP